jgi:hypothetical protein
VTVHITRAVAQFTCDWCSARVDVEVPIGEPGGRMPPGWIDITLIATSAQQLCLDCRTTLERTLDVMGATARAMGQPLALRKQKNLMFEPECRHVRAGALCTERLTMETLAEPMPGYYRFQKGPDVVDVCHQCAGFLTHLIRLRTVPENTLPPPPDGPRDDVDDE